MYYVLCGKNKSNMGDLIGPYLYSKMNGGVVPKQVSKPGLINEKVLLTCGSILQPEIVTKNTVIWGSGIITRSVLFRQKPVAVHAVRGPISRQALLRVGINCPEIYGDPGLLLPRFYMPKLQPETKWKVGIIPHYVDYEYIRHVFNNIAGICVINIDRPVEAVCDDIINCEATISSSLHGIIVSHAYGIPSAWMTTKNALWGDNVKYHDYYASVGVRDHTIKPIEHVKLSKTVNELLELVRNFQQPIRMPDLDALLSVCPFKNSNGK